jgi:hypothetical protein
MSIVIHTVTVTHTGGTDHTYAFSSAPAAHDFAKQIRERGLPAKFGAVAIYSLTDNLAGFEAIESALSAAHKIGEVA